MFREGDSEILISICAKVLINAIKKVEDIHFARGTIAATIPVYITAKLMNKECQKTSKSLTSKTKVVKLITLYIVID